MRICRLTPFWNRMVATVVVVGMSVLAASLKAQQLLPPLPFTFESNTFGMVGLASGQVARLSVLNLGSNNATAATPLSCTAELVFLDSQGTTIKSIKPQVDAGKAMYLDLDRGEISPSSDRVQIRATVRTLAAPTQTGLDQFPQLLCTLIPTLEVFDKSTGKTTIILSQTSVVPLPPFATRVAKDRRVQPSVR